MAMPGWPLFRTMTAINAAPASFSVALNMRMQPDTVLQPQDRVNGDLQIRPKAISSSRGG
jgi:hypothetical protein